MKRSKNMVVVAIAFVSVSLASCHFFDNLLEDENPVEAMYFNESMVDISVGEMGYIYLTVSPASVLSEYDVSYTMSNTSCAEIYQITNNGVVFRGKAEGTSIITARIANAEAKAVVTVKRQ